ILRQYLGEVALCVLKHSVTSRQRGVKVSLGYLAKELLLRLRKLVEATSRASQTCSDASHGECAHAFRQKQVGQFRMERLVIKKLFHWSRPSLIELYKAQRYH